MEFLLKWVGERFGCDMLLRSRFCIVPILDLLIVFSYLIGTSEVLGACRWS